MLSTLADTNSPVGTYPIEAAQGTLSNANYSFSYTNGTLTVTAYALTLVADSQAKVYGATNPVLTGVLTGVVNGDNITAELLHPGGHDQRSGSYAITASLNDPDSKLTNYTTAITNGTLTVSPAALSLAGDSLSKVYGSANPTLTGVLTGVVNNDNITASYSTTADATSPVGSYAIVAMLNDPNNSLTNYTTNVSNGTLTVTPAALSLVADNQTKVYGSGQSDPDRHVEWRLNGDNITASYVTSAAVDSGVGGYAIVASLNDPNSSLSNYTAVISNGVLSVTPAGLTITANPAARAYGSANPVFAAGYSGFVNGEDSGVLSVAPVLATLADTNSPVGTYAITAGGAAAANYQISYVPGVLSVGPAELLVGAQDASRAYGATNPVFAPAYTGFVNGETAGVLAGSPMLSTLADTDSPVGTYPIEAAQGTLSNANYSFSYTNGTLTVTAYALTLVADSQAKVYGATNPVLTGVLTGVVNGDNITASYSDPGGHDQRSRQLRHHGFLERPGQQADQLHDGHHQWHPDGEPGGVEPGGGQPEQGLWFGQPDPDRGADGRGEQRQHHGELLHHGGRDQPGRKLRDCGDVERPQQQPDQLHHQRQQRHPDGDPGGVEPGGGQPDEGLRLRPIRP